MAELQRKNPSQPYPDIVLPIIQPHRSLLHMAGAVGLALAIEYNRTGIFTFMVPAAMGLVILLASWVNICL